MVGLTNAGKRIKATRRKRGLTQKELAQTSGIAQSTISQIETGLRSPTLRTIEKIAMGLEVQLGELLGFTADPDSGKLKEEGDLAS